MDSPFVSILLPSLLVVPAMGLLSSIRSESALGAELKRKTLHVGTGIAALGFPLVLQTPAATLGALGLVIVWMFLVRRIPALTLRFGCVLRDAGRRSSGEIYFAIAIAALLLLPRSGYAGYAIPVLILSGPDALAAIVGRAAPVGRLPGPAVGKTMSGSMAFLLSAFVITTVIVSLMTSLDIAAAMVVGATVAVPTCVMEAVSRRGTDNLTIPLTAWAILFLTLPGAS